MKRLGIIAMFTGLLVSLAGCQTTGEEINRVQTNLVDKSVFEGEWWYTQTIVGVDSDEAAIMGVFEGQMGMADLGADGAQSFSVARVRWVIDQGYLFAYRTYELIDGGNDDGRSEGFRGQPLAVFAIEDHVDVRYDYNSISGERTNVRVEDTSDRRWYERQYVRVDWSQNLITSFYYLTGVDLFGGASRESAPFFFQEGAHDDFPASWQPQFVRIGDDPGYRFADEWPSDMSDAVHYMSFVTQELYSPGSNCLNYDRIPCQTAGVAVRSSFLRVPPNHEYAVETQSHREFDRFGTFRTYQSTYVRGGADQTSIADRCESDVDCGIGGYCDFDAFAESFPGVGVCGGGLTEDYGQTDFLAFYRPRHNHFMDQLTDVECLADWQCDGRFTAGTAGSVCDRAARRCTIPIADREVRQVEYRLSPNFPNHLATSAFEAVGNWNGSFMAGHRGVQGRALPTLADGMSCQSTNPISYCFCGSPDDRGDGTCSYKYDAFQSPADAMAMGVVDPYDCHIQAAEGYTEPVNPTSFDDYSDGVFGYEFVGDECAFVLHANSCDRDPEAACEELGDIRYQFFNYINHGNLRFGGVAIPLVDPTTGEFISSNANMAAPSVESAVGIAIDFFPVLRGEPGAADRYFEGEITREYFDAVGRVERPVTYAPTGTDAYSIDDTGRPGLPTPTNERLRALFEDNLGDIERFAPNAEGRLNVLSDRMRNLAGTPIETRLMESLGATGTELMYGQTDVSQMPNGTLATDPSVIDQTSPFRDGFLDGMMHDRLEMEALSRYSMDPPMAPEISNVVYKYWADRFADRPQEEAAIRMAQLFLRGVMEHELGHAVGLRHNFGGSYDRHQYDDGYYNVVLRDDLELPSVFDAAYDPDGDGFQGGEDLNRFYQDLRDVRDARHEAGLGLTMTNSVMDYDGDMSGFGGLGHYDKAAANWNAFGVIEAFTSDPEISSSGSLDDVTDPRTARTMMMDYRGGESCNIDTDCPYNAARVSQPIAQRCIKNSRESRLPTACGGDRNCTCSPFSEDLIDHSIATDEFFPVDYLFCTDDRVNDISWCSRFDAGESFTETIDFYRRRFEEMYPTNYYRRFRDTYLQGLSTRGFVVDAAKIYQHLFFRYFNEPGFSSATGALGFNDQYFASIDAMNWMTEIVTMPDAGSYAYDADANVYRHVSDEMDAVGSDLTLPVGTGFPMWSKYQEGYLGFNRRERAGVILDKFYAMMALTRRNWNLSFSADERYYINFYNLFPVEMTEFFGGIILDDDRWFGPRVEMVGGNPQIEYLNWNRGSCTDSGGGRAPCRGDQESIYPGTAIADTTPEVLRDWATTLVLSEFPTSYDTSFEQRLSIFKIAAGDSFTLPATQADGTATCAYGAEALPGTGHATGCVGPDADYVIYQSDRFHTGYVAVKVRPRLTYNLEEEQLGFQLLRRLVDRQDRVRALTSGGALSEEERAELASLRTHLTSDESFLEYLIDIQRRYGISDWFL
ncbi:MAG: hypothetical protein DRJ42_18155 [Deltaproteobacteria bacterium]|nr:MAG: hypothetical protein DRJ42_18155 [Deltaproteobacteria bacterium]